MRVLMVTNQLPSADHPGTLAPLARQIESVRAAGAQVEVLEIKGVPKLKYLQSLPRFWGRIARADVVHAHYGYCGWLARSQLHKPVVVSFMGDDLLGTPDATGRATAFSRGVVKLDRWFARTVDAVIVKSAEMARVIAPVKAYIVPNGVDLQTFRPMEPTQVRSALGWAEHKRYVLFPGCPDEPRKGFALAVAAVAQAAARIAEPLELVPLWGVAPVRVPLYMNACHAMVLTSFWEGSPNVVKEAMACNLPIVSVAVGDVPELLAGVDGCAICPRSAEALAEALVWVLTDGRRADGRDTLERKGLDLSGVARRIMDIYADVLAHKRNKQ